jgi:hypothetical protein
LVFQGSSVILVAEGNRVEQRLMEDFWQNWKLAEQWVGLTEGSPDITPPLMTWCLDKSKDVCGQVSAMKVHYKSQGVAEGSQVFSDVGYSFHLIRY